MTISVVVVIGTPFKIGNLVVGSILIYVINAWQIVRVRNKGLRNKTMNIDSFLRAFIAKSYDQVAFAPRTLLQDSILAVSSAKTPDFASVTDFI